MKKRSLFILFLFVLSFLFVVPTLKAADFNTTKKIQIMPEELISDNLYSVSEEIVVDGKITGDLIVIAKKIKINGEVSGDLIAIATEIEINGQVKGSVRVITNTFNLSGSVERNINIFAEEIYLNPGSFVAWDVIGAGKIIFLKGMIDGGVNLEGENVFLETSIKRDVKIKLTGELSSLNVLPETTINGNFKYSNKEELLSINKDNIKGDIEFNQSFPNKNKKEVASLILKILMAIISALFFVYLLKGINKKTITALNNFNSKDLIPALIFLIFTPLVFILLVVSIIGIPLAILIIIFYLIIIYLAKIVTAIFISNFIFEKIKLKKNFLLLLILGIIFSWLIFALPYIGNAASTLAVLFGLGGLIKYVKNQSSDI